MVVLRRPNDLFSMMAHFFRQVLFVSSFLMPLSAFAQTELPNRVLDLMGKIYNVILNPIIALLFGLAFAYFIWGIVRYVWSGEQESMREEGRRAIVWGVIGMFVMFSVFGILRLVIGTIGADPDVLGSV
jgi:hypothetical protein